MEEVANCFTKTEHLGNFSQRFSWLSKSEFLGAKLPVLSQFV